MPSTTKRGKEAELAVIQWLLQQNAEVGTPVTEDTSWDLFFRWKQALDSDPLARGCFVQVKRAYMKRGSLVVNTKPKNRHYTPWDADYLVAVHVKGKEFWLIPFWLIYEKTRIVLGKEYEKYKWQSRKP